MDDAKQKALESTLLSLSIEGDESIKVATEGIKHFAENYITIILDGLVFITDRDNVYHEGVQDKYIPLWAVKDDTTYSIEQVINEFLDLEKYPLFPNQYFLLIILSHFIKEIQAIDNNYKLPVTNINRPCLPQYYNTRPFNQLTQCQKYYEDEHGKLPHFQ